MTRPRPHPGTSDDGFTLVEMIVAMLLATIVFTALAGAAMAGLRATVASRQNQQATDFMTRDLERSRLVDFAALGHTATDLVGDPLVVSCGAPATSCVDVDPGPAVLFEPLVVLPLGAAIDDHTTTPSTATESNATAYTVSTYVTRVAGQDPALVRRVTVHVTWTAYGQQRTRTTSSLLSAGNRGLPLPRFTLTPVGYSPPLTVNPGAQAVFAARLTNQGATDRWSLTTSGPPAWELRLDDGDGAYSSTTDLPLTDTDADGTADTGVLRPAGSVAVWLVRTTGTTETGSSAVALTATSVGQPASATATQSLSYSLVVQGGVITPTPTASPSSGGAEDCSTAYPDGDLDLGGPLSTPTGGYSLVARSLHNDAVPGTPTPARAQLVMNTAAAYASSLVNYSTDVDATGSGRVLRTRGAAGPAGPLAETDPHYYAQWRHQVGNRAVTVDGDSRLRVWVKAPTGEAVFLRWALFTATSGGTPQVGQVVDRSAVLSGWSCAGFREVVLDSGDITPLTVPKNGYLGVRLASTGPSDVRIAYDVAGAYPASFAVGEK